MAIPYIYPKGRFVGPEKNKLFRRSGRLPWFSDEKTIALFPRCIVGRVVGSMDDFHGFQTRKQFALP